MAETSEKGSIVNHKVYTEKRPWGYFENLIDAEKEGYKVKRLVVEAGKRLSKQYHNHRKEHWICVKGKGQAEVGYRKNSSPTINNLVPGVTLDIPKTARHRLYNTGNEDLVIIEIQMGDYLGEDDIVRIEDDFGRV